METRDWCLKDIDYTKVNFFPGPVRPGNDQQRHDQCNTRTDIPTTGRDAQTDEHVRRHDGKMQTLQTAATSRLREAILDRRKLPQIPKIVAKWPSETLRLRDVVSVEECRRALGSLDVLWTQLFHALLVLSADCQLTCLDLTHFPNTKGLLYTVVQLVPFLTLTADNLDKQTIFDMVVSKTDSDDEGLLTNLEIFLDRVLRHPVFHTGRRLKLPNGKLDVVLDCVPVSADKLPFLCLLTAVAIQPATHVHFDIRSVVFTYKEPGPEFVPIDPLLPLQLLNKLTAVWNLDGLSTLEVPEGRCSELFNRKGLNQFSSLRKLSLANCKLDLTAGDTRRDVINGLSKLKHLTRLDLATCDVTGHLAEILGAVHSPLEYLGLCYCRLLPSDVDSLIKSRHSLSLKDLDASYVYADSCEVLNPRQKGDDARHAPHDSGVYDDGSSSASISTLSGADTGVCVRLPVECVHTARDRDLFLSLVNGLPSFAELVSLDFSNHAFDFKLDTDVLRAISNSLGELSKLKQITMQDLPLWDDSTVALIRHIVPQLQQLQNFSFSRSLDAPTLNMHDKLVFWKKVHKVKEGRRLRLEIANFASDGLYASMPDSEDDVWSEYSSIGNDITGNCRVNVCLSPSRPAAGVHTVIPNVFNLETDSTMV